MPVFPTDTTDSNVRWLKLAQVEAMRDAAREGSFGLRNDAMGTVVEAEIEG